MNGKKPTSYYRDVAAKVDVMPGVDPAAEQEALREARQNATANPISKEDTLKKVVKGNGLGKEFNDDSVTSKMGKKKLKLYRGAVLSGYKHLLALGIKESVIARVFGLRYNAFANLKQNGDEGVKRAYDEAMAELEPILTASMLKQALGYEYTEVKTTYERKMIADNMSLKKNLKPSKQLVKTKVEKTTKHYPGRPQLFMYYMATHFPEKWKIKGADGAGGVHFHITGDIIGEQISALAGKYLTAPAKVIDNEVIGEQADE